MSDIDFSLVLPMYNEEESVTEVAEALLNELRKSGVKFELVLVDNGSSDGTQERIRTLSVQAPEISLAVVPKNLGYGWGIITGLSQAQGRHLGFMAGDGQIAPQDVVRTYEAFLGGQYDLCKVNRVRRADGWNRVVISVICNSMFRIIFGATTADINGTPKIFRRSLLPYLNPQSKDWFLDAEIFLKIASVGNVYEVPVDFLPRQGGSSNVRWKTLWEFVVNMSKLAARSIFRRLTFRSSYTLTHQQVLESRRSTTSNRNQ